MNKLTILISVIVLIISVCLMGLLVKGNTGTKGQMIAYQTIKGTNVEGPFESSNTNSRYALVEAIVEQNTFYLDDEKARFSAPDIGRVNGQTISLFTPGISFIAVPFYIVGKQYQLPQLVTFFSTITFGLINIYLIAAVSKKLYSSYLYGIIGGLIFQFATNALPYSLTLTQHQASTTIILLGVLNALSKRTVLNNLCFGMLYGIGVLVDFPNAFLLFPAVLYILSKHITLVNVEKKVQLKLRTVILFLLFGLLPFLIILGYYNLHTTGIATKLPQYVGQSKEFDPGHKEQIKKPVQKQKAVDLRLADTPFDTRLQLGGTYILLFSDERGLFYYAPIVLFGLLGFILVYRMRGEQQRAIVLLSAIISTNIVIYSTFGDPWGGWSYGPRYLIPAIALLSSGIGVFIQRYRKNIYLLIPFILTVIYGALISIAAALTSNAIPPKNEALNLDTPMKYTYQYNFDFIFGNQSSSLVYNLWGKQYISLPMFLFWIIVAFTVLIVGIYFIELFRQRKI